MNTRQGFPVVVAAPSGTGKTTVCRAVVERDPEIEFSVSHTTRLQRPKERDGVDYHFVTREEFARMVADGAFLEWAEYNGNCYGIDEVWPPAHTVMAEHGSQQKLDV